MSLTILSQPSTAFISAGNNNFFVVNGTTVSVSGVTEYKYKADLYIGGEYATTLTAFPEPGTNYGVFNLLNILNNYVSFDFPVSGSTTISTSPFTEAPNSYGTMVLSFYEEYVTGTTFVTSAYGPSSNNFGFINSAFAFDKSLQINLGNYIIGTSASKFLLTNENAASYLFPAYTDMHSWLHFFHNETVRMQVITRDSSFNALNTYYFADTATGYTGIVNLSTGIADLSGTVNFTNAAYYDVNLVLPSSTTAQTQTIRYQVLQNCGRFAPTSYKVYWLGAFGEFNSWYFTKKAVITSNKTQSTYKKVLGKVNSSGQVVQKTYDHQVTPFYTSVNDQIVLSTDFLADDDVLFLKGLYQSPIVYMQDQSGIIQAITIAQDSYVINKRVNKRPYSLQLTVQTSVNDYTQLI